VYFGEVSLSGVVRPVPQVAIRLREARKLGFTRAVVPESARSDTPDATLSVTAVGSLASLVAEVAAQSVDRDRRVTKLRHQDG